MLGLLVVTLVSPPTPLVLAETETEALTDGDPEGIEVTRPLEMLLVLVFNEREVVGKLAGEAVSIVPLGGVIAVFTEVLEIAPAPLKDVNPAPGVFVPVAGKEGVPILDDCNAGYELGDVPAAALPA